MKKRTLVNEQVIRDNLPTPPAECTYSIEKVSELVYKVWIHYHRTFDYTTDPVKCIHSYIKRDMVHPAKNKEKMKVSAHCHISELSKCDAWSILNDLNSIQSLQHL